MIDNIALLVEHIKCNWNSTRAYAAKNYYWCYMEQKLTSEDHTLSDWEIFPDNPDLVKKEKAQTFATSDLQMTVNLFILVKITY